MERIYFFATYLHPTYQYSSIVLNGDYLRQSISIQTTAGYFNANYSKILLQHKVSVIMIKMKTNEIYDLCIIGGGINGCGIARDAAGRDLSVLLCEQDDLASGTSSRSSKLIHGGLRYLEQYQFGLVREALKE